MSAPMQPIVRIGHQPHPRGRKKYGQPRVALYWASPRKRFMYPGLHLWTGKRNIRIFPLRAVR